MPDKPPALLDSAIHLLFRTIELPGARIAGSVLQDHFESAALSLRTAKLLVANGHALSAAALGDHDDTPVELIWIPELNGYGYSSSLR